MAAHARSPRYERIHALSFEVRRLNESSSALLSAALIEAGSEASSAEVMRSTLVWPLEDLAVIEKCNAVIVVATVSIDTAPDFVRQVLLDRWLEAAFDLGRVLPQIEHYAGFDALEYLGQVAVGLRSVVLGDGQVYAQVVQGLRTAQGAEDQRSPFLVVSRRLGALRKAVRSGTSLQEGNVSLERLAAERVGADLGVSGASVAIAGYGRTGQLLAEILSKETDHDLVVTNRTPLADGSRPGRVGTVPWDDLSIYDTADAVVVCLANTAETRRYIERFFETLPDGKQPLVIDMSSPSITQQIAAKTAPVVQLDELTARASASLEERQRGSNKARQVVREWAEDLEHDLALMAAREEARRKPAALQGLAVPTARRRDQLLRMVREYMANAGFVETQTRCLSPTGELRRSIQIDSDLLRSREIDRIYEIGPVWAPDAVWAPSQIDETYVLAAGVRDPTDLDQLVELAVGLTERAAQGLQGTALSCRRIDYETALELMQNSGYSVDYGATLDFGLLRNIADVVRFDTGERIVAVTDCPEPAERVEVARHPKTGLARSFRVVLDGWQVASGSILELDTDTVRRRIVLSGVAVTPPEPLVPDVDEKPLTGTIEVALNHLVARCAAPPCGARLLS